MTNKTISDALGLRPIEEALEDENDAGVPDVLDASNVPATTASSDADIYEDHIKDIEVTRTNIEKIVKDGGKALSELIELATQSENIKAYEAASDMMKTLLLANKEFVEASQKKKYAKEEVSRPDAGNPTTNVTNNNLILSTADLIKMMGGETDDE